jgi:hypothetical protein
VYNKFSTLYRKKGILSNQKVLLPNTWEEPFLFRIKLVPHRTIFILTVKKVSYYRCRRKPSTRSSVPQVSYTTMMLNRETHSSTSVPTKVCNRNLKQNAFLHFAYTSTVYIVHFVFVNKVYQGVPSTSFSRSKNRNDVRRFSLK